MLIVNQRWCLKFVDSTVAFFFNQGDISLKRAAG